MGVRPCGELVTLIVDMVAEHRYCLVPLVLTDEPRCCGEVMEVLRPVLQYRLEPFIWWLQDLIRAQEARGVGEEGEEGLGAPVIPSAPAGSWSLPAGTVQPPARRWSLQAGGEEKESRAAEVNEFKKEYVEEVKKIADLEQEERSRSVILEARVGEELGWERIQQQLEEVERQLEAERRRRQELEGELESEVRRRVGVERELGDSASQISTTSYLGKLASRLRARCRRISGQREGNPSST